MSVFILSAPFPGHTNAVIVTPTPLKADVVPNAGVVIAPSHLGGVCLQLRHLFLHHSMMKSLDGLCFIVEVTCLLISIFSPFMCLRRLDFMLCLIHTSLTSRLPPKKSLILPAAKIRKSLLVPVRTFFFPEKHIITKSPPIITSLFACLFFSSSQSARIRPRLTMWLRSSPKSPVTDQQRQCTFGQERTKSGLCFCVCVSLMFFRLNIMP